MKYVVLDDRILIEKHEDFDAKQILESGQIFRYGKSADFWWCASGDKFAKIYEKQDAIEIKTASPAYFEEFFDLKTDYSKIKRKLSQDPFMAKVVSFCPGIRILKREKQDTIIEFIISANNNISRIKKIVDTLCVKLGENKGEYYAFPTLKKLSEQTLEFFNSLGAGYRGEYLYKSVQILKNLDIENLSRLSSDELKKFLIDMPGIGPKVASCIMLFGFNRGECFPVDTWIEKVYRENFGGKLKSRTAITEYFETKFGKNSGIAQQFLFYAKRENILK